MLPTPRPHAGGGGGADSKRATRPGAGGPTLADALLLPTPTATPYGTNQSPTDGAAVRPSLSSLESWDEVQGPAQRAAVAGSDGSDPWGVYGSAIARHERLVGRPAPAPTEPGPKGGKRLSVRFVEWLMCWAHEWVQVPGLNRNDMLKVCGNGVVTPQAEAALDDLVGIACSDLTSVELAPTL